MFCKVCEFASDCVAIVRLRLHLRYREVYVNDNGHVEWCYCMLDRVSRSFALVIRRLPQQIRNAVCIFYLVLRGLDTVEDDMSLPPDRKCVLLRDFYLCLESGDWTLSHLGENEHSRALISEFHKVLSVYRTLHESSRKTIQSVTRQMGAGMAEFVQSHKGCDTLASYNLYCHYVAGLVGLGLTRLFCDGCLEDADQFKEDRLANSMGLFLQKTNIIRDYKEDLDQGRPWWPHEIWSKYASDLQQLGREPNAVSSLGCLQHLIADALQHVPDVLDYLSRLRNPDIFQFCAVPQVMAMATLAQLHNNPLVFSSVVKVTRGLACRILLDVHDMQDVVRWFDLFAGQMERDKSTKQLCSPNDVIDSPSFAGMLVRQKIGVYNKTHPPTRTRSSLILLVLLCILALAACLSTAWM